MVKFCSTLSASTSRLSGLQPGKYPCSPPRPPTGLSPRASSKKPRTSEINLRLLRGGCRWPSAQAPAECALSPQSTSEHASLSRWKTGRQKQQPVRLRGVHSGFHRPIAAAAWTPRPVLVKWNSFQFAPGKRIHCQETPRFLPNSSAPAI